MQGSKHMSDGLQDHFEKRLDAIRALQRLCVDHKTREQRFCVSTGGEFMRNIESHPVLGPLCAAIKPNTLKGWFVFVGHGKAAKFPEPKACFTAGLNKGYNAERRISLGRPKMLEGCEDVLEGFAAEVQQFREAGVSINTYNLKYMLVAALQQAGKGHLLSPHLTEEDGEVDRKKFTASKFWLRTFLHKYLRWSWRSSTSAAQSTPSNADQLTDEMLQRIAYLCRAHCIPPERTFMADETYAHLTPDSHFTFAPEGSKEVHMTGKEDKLGVTVMVTSTAAGAMLPMQAIAKGITQLALRKFVNGSTFTELGGGYKAKATATSRKTFSEDGTLAHHPPFFRDPATGHMIVAGETAVRLLQFNTEFAACS
jgi:hypothetical protein